MRTITIRSGSALLGAALAAVVFFSMGQSALGSAQGLTLLRVEYVPHPRDYVQIAGGTPYTVPAGKILVLTALGTTSGAGTTSLEVDGVQEMRIPSGSGDLMTVAPPGFSVSAGKLVTLTNGGSGPERAWGYLVDE